MNEYEYFDLQTDSGTVCMDGETCIVVDSGDFGYELLNIDNETDTRFTLTKEEAAIAIFEQPLLK